MLPSVPLGLFCPLLLLLLLVGASAAHGATSRHAVPRRQLRSPTSPLSHLARGPQLKAPGTREDQWCTSLKNGLHADLLAIPPCSGYFQCSGGSLSGLFPCPTGLYFSEHDGFCRSLKYSTCAPMVHHIPDQGQEQDAPQLPPLPWTSPEVHGGASDELQGQRSLLELQAKLKLQSSNFKGVHVRYKPRELLSGGLAYQSSIEGDLQALMDFKQANVDPQNVLHSWTIDRPDYSSLGASVICRGWYGVKCAGGRVVALDLSNWLQELAASRNRSLWGDPGKGQSIPDSFGNLDKLKYLNLKHNWDNTFFVGGLIGPIPTALGLCTALTYLDLSYNNFDGSLPDALGQLTGLQSLILSTNLLTGSIPSTLGRLSALATFSAGFNNFTGILPAELGQLTNLTDLDLSFNPHVEGGIPDSLSQLRNLTSLTLSNMNLGGTLPTFWRSLSQLCNLNLRSCNLTGQVPQSLGYIGSRCTAYSVMVDISSNALSGELSPPLVNQLCNSKRGTPVSDFKASGNALTGPLPLGLGSCAGLGNLDLSENQLTGPLFSAETLLSLTYLTGLSLGFNKLEGSIPLELSKLALISLNISGNSLTGRLPSLSCDLGLAVLDVHNNQMSGPLNANLGPEVQKCTTLTTLDLSGNKFSGSIPSYLLTLPGGSSTALSLSLQGNNLSESLPVLGSKQNCPALQLLNVSGNSLQGTIPFSLLAKCKSLVAMDLSSNQLTGPIPTILAALRSLVNLNLSNNQLTGPIPDQLPGWLKQLALLDLSNNQLNGSIPSIISNIQQLFTLDLSRNDLTGTIPWTLTSLNSLRSLSLDHNSLSGSIPDVLIPQNLNNLALLDLAYNNLSADIPYGYANVSQFPGLVVNFSNNNLSGPVPGELASMPEAISNNPSLCGAPGYPSCPGPPGLSGAQIAGIVVGSVLALVLMLGIAWWCLKPKDEWTDGTMLVFEKLDFPLTGKDILDMTNCFDDKYMLGKGGFGAVYRATLQDGRVVAIKRLKENSSQGNKEFEAEIMSLGNIRHRNLVTLVAAYIAAPPSKERVLMYDFMPGGSLDKILDSDEPMDEDSPFRRWDVRRNISLDVARGLQYLHHDCQPRIIHRDMKPANVLLDDQLLARVADFGLARQADTTKSHMSTAVYGTVGYLALEYVRDGRLSFKSDVYAFGVTLLQIITGKRPTDKELSERGLSRWVSCQTTDQVIDPRMKQLSEEDLAEIRGAVKLGLLCTSKVPADRPSMNEVYHLLGHLEDFAEGMTGNQVPDSEPFSST